jgi:hypothetical protein
MDTISKNTSDFSIFERIADIQRAKNLLDLLPSDVKMIKTASSGESDSNEIVKAVIEAFSSMGIKANVDIGELMKKISGNPIKKEAMKKDDSEVQSIKIASKKIEDSHYDIDIAKDRITRDGKKVIMVSAYLKEAYLGRYLIKRNYYFLDDNEDDANYVYNDLVAKSNRTKGRYYKEIIGVKGIFPEVKAFLDGVKGDLELDATSIGTTVVREDTRGHEVNGSPYAAAAHK